MPTSTEQDYDTAAIRHGLETDGIIALTCAFDPEWVDRLREDVDAAFTAAAKAFESQRWTTPSERQRMLLRFADVVEGSAQELADKFKEGLPVIMNLEAADREVSRRLIDFASGLCYALDGSMEKVATGVYLLKPIASRPPTYE